jgi:alkaline phosphatase
MPRKDAKSSRIACLVLAAILALLAGSVPGRQPQVQAQASAAARYVILMISDGWGIRQIEATNSYTGESPLYQRWAQHWMAHYPAGEGYDPDQAWSDFDYVKNDPTDSAAAATALYSGVKTAIGMVSVSPGGERLQTIGDEARELGMGVGAVTTVWVSDATPGAWYAHNDSRNNRYAIADEGFFGDPNAIASYSGGHGPTLPPADVIVGAMSASYVHPSTRDRLFDESGQPGRHVLVERIAGSPDGGPRLLAAAYDPAATRLAGLFGQSYHRADGSGYDPENPTLADMTVAALIVLSRNPGGFVLLVEGGAVDWAGHANNMDLMVGEQIDFDRAVQEVIWWVDNPFNGSSWEDTLVIVTGDHETGYLTAGPGVFPDQPLGEVSATTLAMEKVVPSSGYRASWDDVDGDDEIEAEEDVYWAWNSSLHTNSLIPLYANGAGSQWFAFHATGSDPVRGAYIDNTDAYQVIHAALTERPAAYLPLVLDSE